MIKKIVQGELLSDARAIISFWQMVRSTSLDEFLAYGMCLMVR